MANTATTGNNNVRIVFAQPFTVGQKTAEQATGRVAVLDLAFNAGAPNSVDREADFRSTTGAFVEALGARLVCWVDHHPHAKWGEYARDEKFVLKSREEAPACPVITGKNLAEQFGQVDTIVAHGDFDGVMSAAKFAMGGVDPYEGATADAVAADTRKGELSPRGRRYEEAMKADLRNDAVRLAVFRELVSGEVQSEIDEARKAYVEIQAETARLAALYEARGEHVRFVSVIAAQEHGEVAYDLTQVLLAGQRDGKVAIALNKNFKGELQLTVAGAPTWNFVSMLGLPGGMPNRVNIDPSRLEEAIKKINAA